jgi:(p)ppGpp synthase/HD superfamily hydrolase
MGSAISPKFLEALGYSFDIHKAQLRKGTKIPYIAHLLAVCAIVIEYGGEEEHAIAALLHDAAEDGGGEAVLCEIELRFGRRVAGIVKACSDSITENESDKPDWKLRKEFYLSSIREKHYDALIVSLADKIHNSRSIANDLRVIGEAVWERFKGGREGTLWYYKLLLNRFEARIRTSESLYPMIQEFKRGVADLQLMAQQAMYTG